ncbi:MAG: hypothetical protein KC476_08825 [Cyanobacteria bacterium HKST-UBA06]|nr:hypothetical protein [Cyanobacteria bacterium HKST-UBA05]MCA9798113.1 hypothetical protein [Cyanobacteria bacterium HKST-UBA04]MCA9808045.1 hypothetical protein [Cyanobacteria bacterium HKST-UBA06]MCA9841855.1 hypothetical protein [Cyanobacteria bacterium HKST-UBA03]
MVFEGSIRPSQALYSADILGSSHAVTMAAEEAERRRKNEALKKLSKTDANKQQQGHTLDTIKNALVEGLPHQIEEKQFERFDPLHLYQFVYDADLDQIHLLDMHTGKIKLTLSAQDFQAVADNLVNAYGTMTDRVI